jgi:hypothetical protein
LRFCDFASTKQMKLQTQIPLGKESNNPIEYNSNILLLGSCFVEHIGEKFEYFKFQNFQNPFGILFHPLAIERVITNAVHEKVYTEKDVFFQNEQWHCFEAHSKLSQTSKDDLLHTLNESVKLTQQYLQESTHVIITLGTAWVYRFIETDTIVANCHKVPQKKFSKELMQVDEVIQSLRTIESLIKSVNPKVSIVFTVSPVRHIKDGFIENTQSKAHLVSAIHNVLSHRAQSRCFYFPSYEIMLDELRDYRFYNEDMLHPSNVAINYIWEKFKQVWITQESEKILNDVEVVQKGLLHKPFNSNSVAHQQFLQNLEDKKAQLLAQFQYMVFK